VLVLRKEQEPEDTDDPVYGTALRRTWAWLQERESAAGGPLDLGVEALASLLPEDLDPLLAPTTDAPLLFPAWCDLWVQTGPEPATSPDPAIFLHGPRREAADVRVVWRADLSPERPETWADTVAMAPPMTGECLPLPFWIAARWLAGQKLNDMAGDLMGVRAPAETLPEGEARALRWGGPDASDLIASSDLRPGDLVVVPSSRGGCDEEGWNPAASEVKDLAARAAVAARRRPVLRLHPSLFGDFGEAAALVEPLARLDGAELPDTIDEDVAELLGALEAREDLSEAMTVTVWALARDPRRRVEPHPSGTGLIVTGRKASTSSLGDAPVPLREHLRDVERWTRRIGTLAGLSEDLVSDLALAARLHDLGKADPRFQVWLAGGDPLRAARGGLLAKSERVPRSPKSRQLARIRSGYPKGGRHELLSLRLAESVPDVLATARNPVLVLHLVASHHGHCRPFAPVVEDPSPIPVSCELDGLALRASTDTGLERIDSGVPERFWTLVRRHGWWGLSFLETCLRLADHRASERPGGAA
jgi:CRISPR-associated endonuclease/helicase Cas3